MIRVIQGTVRRWHLWFIVGMLALGTIFQYPQQLPIIGPDAPSSLLGVERHAIERVFFLLPTTYAALVFGIRGGLIAVLVALAAMLPRTIWLSKNPADAALEAAGVVAMGILISLWLENYQRERRQRERMLSELQAAHQQLHSNLQVIQRREAERKQAEEALRESEQRFRDIATSVSEWIAEVNREGTYAYSNPMVEEILGYLPEEVVGRGVLDFLYPDERERSIRLFQESLSKKEGLRGFLTRMVHRDGSVRDVEVSAIPLFDERGIVVGLRGITLDVTERKQAEEALREAKEFAEGLIASMQDGLSVLDSRGVHIGANSAFCEMTGFSREELIGAGLPHPYWPPEEYEEIEEAFQKTLRGEFDDLELTFMRKNDERFPVIVSPSWMKDEQGSVVSYFATVKDITQRKRAEEALRESEERLREVLEVSRDYIYKHNLETGKYDYISPAALQITGFTPEEFVAMGFEEAQRRVHPEDLEPHRAHLENLLSQTAQPAMPPTIRYRWKCKDGQYHWFSDNRAVIRDDDGRPIARVGNIRDVTELKRGEESLRRRSHDLGERVKELGCLYGISDLVQTPGISLGEILQGAVDFVPAAWQYPEVTCARIVLEDQEFRTENFRETAWKQSSDIIVNGERSGTVEVCYLEEKPEIDEGPFLREEGELINAVAEQLGRVVERKRAEETLRESEEKYRRVVEDSIDGIAIAQGLEIRFVNRALLRMFGYESGTEMVGRRFTEFLSPEYRELMAQRLNAREVSECEPGHYEQRAVRKDGREFPIEVSAGTITYDGARAHQVVIRDITERKQAEDALQKAREELETRVERQMQRGNPYGLTFRELTVLHLVAAGRADKEIGAELGISVQTAQKHVANILGKMDAASRTEASVRAVREGLLD